MKSVGSAYLGACVLFFYLPILILAVFSLNSAPLMAFPLTGFSFAWYRTLADNSVLLTGLLTSFLIAQPVAILSTSLGILAGLGLTAKRLRWRAAFMLFLVVPFIVPKGVLAIAQIMVMTRIGLDRGLAPLILSQALVALPFTTLLITAVLVRMDVRLEEAARDLGANPWQTFRLVVVPQLSGGLLAAYSVGMILSLSDLTLSMFLAGRVQPLSMIVASAFRRELSPELNAMQVVMLILTLVVVLASELARRLLVRRTARRAALARARRPQGEWIPGAKATP